MEKKRYYVSVQAGTVLENKGDAAYEYEIEATPEEVQALMILLEEKYDDDWLTFFRAHISGVPYHYDRENDLYDNDLREIYSLIHRLGTEETKRQIESAGLVTSSLNDPGI
ncbi:hypothetical protein LOK74_01060 [Brevibacillus humidisoli]|uniref:hypothetical protein n=1 Tax=Brevibacillus humidisoli TaxID=2895522 RepID=UPI001E2825BF|nr:hypothetical protein [Brevibacillus humidisoli]UFJ41181.1 hypothetical protein LOK74_01060 [Brevibacillus humidisoli]